MKNLTCGLDIGVKEYLISIFLSVSKNNGLFVNSSIAEYNVLDNRESVMEWAIHSQMAYGVWSF